MVVVRVTKADIRKGRPGMWHMCPVAHALNRATGKKWRVIGRKAENEDGCWISLPVSVNDFVRKFDALSEGDPFEFSIEE